MTVQAIRDLFLIKYKLECSQRNMREIEFGNKTILTFLSGAEAAIQDELQIISSAGTITLVAGTKTYSLPVDFADFIGQPKMLIGTTYSLLEQISLADYKEDMTTDNGTPLKFAVYRFQGSAPVIGLLPTPSTSGTISFAYKMDIFTYYAGDTNANFADEGYAAYDGSTPTGNIVLPPKYADLIISKMLTNLFPDYEQKYQLMLKDAKYSRPVDNKKKLGYSYSGGITVG